MPGFGMLLTEGNLPEASIDLGAIMTDAVNTVQSNIFETLAIVVPAIVVVVGAVVGVRFGIKWLKSLGKA